MADVFIEHMRRKGPIPEESNYILHTAYYFNDLGRHDSAMWHAARALEDDRLGLHLRAGAFQCIGDYHFDQGDYSKARYYYDRAIQADPTPDVTDLTARVRLGFLEDRLGNVQKADSMIRNAVLHYGFYWYGKEKGYCMYGDFLLEHGRVKEAMRSYHKALQFAPYYCLPFAGLAKCYLAMGKKREALDALAGALENYYLNPEKLMSDKHFKKLKRSKKFSALLKKYDHLNVE